MSTIPSHPSAANIQGDAIQGDKFGGDKIMGNKITYVLEGKRISLPSRADLLAYLAALHQTVDFARWADLPAEEDAPLYETSDGVAPDTYIATHARPLPTRIAAFRPQQESQTASHEVVETLLEAKRTVILGEPGSGKTSALQRLAWLLAERTSTVAAEMPITLPIFARLADYQGESDLLPLLRRAINSLGVLEIEDEASLRQLLRAKNVLPVLLLDGLNELETLLSQSGLRCLRNHLADYPGHAVHVTCRTADYDVATQTLPNAPIWLVQPLCDEIRYWDDKQGESDIRTYLRRHLGEEGGKRLYERLRSDDRLHSLAQVPLFLWMLKETAGSTAGALPVDRGGLLRSFVDNLLQNQIDKNLQHAAEQSLQQLAWHWQEGGRLEGNEDELEQILHQLPSASARRHSPLTIRQALQNCGLLLDLGRSRLKLLHHLVREYAAASYLVRQPDCAKRLPLLARQEDWRECLILALWLRKELHTPDYLLALMGDALVDVRVRVEAARILAQVGDPRLAVRQARLADGKPISFIEPAMVAIPAGNAILGGQDEDAYDDELPQCVVPIAAFELAVHPVTNAEFKCFVDAGGYEDESLWTPGGQGWLRGEGTLDGETEQSLRQQHQSVCEDVEGWIADLKREQALDEEDADTWRVIATWSEDQFVDLYAKNLLGEIRRQPFFWQDSRYNLPNQPVVGVNWYEAMAYAEWLSRVTEKRYMLPSEAEWEWAARRQTDPARASDQPGRKYPWGDDWEADCCNWSGSRLNQGSPIGCFPQGATLDGLQDLAGNVYEWTRSLYRPYPYVADDGREDATADGLRVYRGGSWYTDRRRVRCAFRVRHGPWYRFDYGGIRLARAFL